MWLNEMPDIVQIGGQNGKGLTTGVGGSYLLTVAVLIYHPHPFWTIETHNTTRLYSHKSEKLAKLSSWSKNVMSFTIIRIGYKIQ